MSKARIILVHWKATEAALRLRQLRDAGYRASLYTEHGGAGLPAIRANPPDLFVIDCDRLPSHGRAVATWLRRQKPTRPIPMVFVGGEPEKVAKTRKLLPDAVFTDWRRIRGALRQARAHPPAEPVVPGTMQEYSGTPLPKKLGIKKGLRLALLGAPDDFEDTLGTLPNDVGIRNSARGLADMIVLFVKSRADLKRRFPAAQRALADHGKLWIAWPKKSSGVTSDLNQPAVRRFGLDSGMVDFKICAIDETWSGLCFVRRGGRQ